MARDGETLITLDDVERTLTPDDLLICDGDDVPVGIGGIMGGASSEIDDATTDVLLEMAWFHPIGIVKSSRRHKLRSEAQRPLREGLRPEVIDLAMRRFAELLGAPLEDGAAVATGTLPERPPVRVRTARVARLLGTELSTDADRRAARPDRVRHHAGRRRPRRRRSRRGATTPRPRSTSSRRSPATTATPRSAARSRARPTPGRSHPRQAERRRLRSLLVGRGLTEAMPMPFLAPGELAACGLPDDGITIANPLVAEQSVLRTALLPGLVGAVAYNWSHRNHGVRLFEIGHIFNRPSSPDADLPDERECLGAVLAGREAPEAVHLWQFVAEELAVPGARIENGEVPGFHPTRAARILVGDVVVGRRRRDRSRACSTPTASASGSPTSRSTSTRCSTCRTATATFRPFSRFPSSDIDLAFEVDEDVPASAVEDAIRSAGGDLLWSVRLFDVYRGAGVAEGRRSLAYTLRLQAADRTLTDADVAQCPAADHRRGAGDAGRDASRSAAPALLGRTAGWRVILGGCGRSPASSRSVCSWSVRARPTMTAGRSKTRRRQSPPSRASIRAARSGRCTDMTTRTREPTPASRPSTPRPSGS